MQNEDSVAEKEARQRALAQALKKLQTSMKRHLRRSDLLRNWHVAVKRTRVECYPLVKIDDPNQTKMVDFASPQTKPSAHRRENK